MPKVSIVIPVYNVELYIERCARSLFEQTLDDIEYLFIDDCCLDCSMEILERTLNEYPKRKEQVKIIHRRKNGGQATVRKQGVQLATGEYVIHCDSDDWVEFNMYELLYNEAICKDADMVICNFKDIYPNKTVILSQRPSSFNSMDLANDLLYQRIRGSFCNKLIRKSCYDKIPFSSCDMWEDLTTVLKIVLNIKTIAYLPDLYYNYNINPQSICQRRSLINVIKKTEQRTRNIIDLIGFYKERGFYNQFFDAFLHLKFGARRDLERYLLTKSIYTFWKNVFPEINKSFMSTSTIPVYSKIRFILCQYRIIPILYWLKDRLK